MHKKNYTTKQHHWSAPAIFLMCLLFVCLAGPASLFASVGPAADVVVDHHYGWSSQAGQPVRYSEQRLPKKGGNEKPGQLDITFSSTSGTLWLCVQSDAVPELKILSGQGEWSGPDRRQQMLDDQGQAGNVQVYPLQLRAKAGEPQRLTLDIQQGNFLPGCSYLDDNGPAESEHRSFGVRVTEYRHSSPDADADSYVLSNGLTYLVPPSIPLPAVAATAPGNLLTSSGGAYGDDYGEDPKHPKKPGGRPALPVTIAWGDSGNGWVPLSLAPEGLDDPDNTIPLTIYIDGKAQVVFYITYGQFYRMNQLDLLGNPDFISALVSVILSASGTGDYKTVDDFMEQRIAQKEKGFAAIIPYHLQYFRELLTALGSAPGLYEFLQKLTGTQWPEIPQRIELGQAGFTPVSAPIGRDGGNSGGGVRYGLGGRDFSAGSGYPGGGGDRRDGDQSDNGGNGGNGGWPNRQPGASGSGCSMVCEAEHISTKTCGHDIKNRSFSGGKKATVCSVHSTEIMEQIFGSRERKSTILEEILKDREKRLHKPIVPPQISQYQQAEALQQISRTNEKQLVKSVLQEVIADSDRQKVFDKPKVLLNALLDALQGLRHVDKDEFNSKDRNTIKLIRSINDGQARFLSNGSLKEFLEGVSNELGLQDNAAHDFYMNFIKQCHHRRTILPRRWLSIAVQKIPRLTEVPTMNDRAMFYEPSVYGTLANYISADANGKWKRIIQRVLPETFIEDLFELFFRIPDHANAHNPSGWVKANYHEQESSMNNDYYNKNQLTLPEYLETFRVNTETSIQSYTVKDIIWVLVVHDMEVGRIENDLFHSLLAFIKKSLQSVLAALNPEMQDSLYTSVYLELDKLLVTFLPAPEQQGAAVAAGRFRSDPEPMEVAVAPPNPKKRPIPENFGKLDITDLLTTHRQRFINEMDASAVILEFVNLGLCSNGDQVEIKRISNPVVANQQLHYVLCRKATAKYLYEAMLHVAGLKGEPKMQAFATFFLGEMDRYAVRYTKKTAKEVLDTRVEEFLREMSSQDIAQILQVYGYIPQSVETDINNSKSRSDANIQLLRFLRNEASDEQIKGTLHYATNSKAYGRMAAFAQKMLDQIE